MVARHGIAPLPLTVWPLCVVATVGVAFCVVVAFVSPDAFRYSVAISRHGFVSPVVSGWFPLVGITRASSTTLSTSLVCFSSRIR
jgi:hypothetical protein